MKYEYILVPVDCRTDVLSINLDFLEKGWEVVGSVSQIMGGQCYKDGMIVFTLRRPIPE